MTRMGQERLVGLNARVGHRVVARRAWMVMDPRYRRSTLGRSGTVINDGRGDCGSEPEPKTEPGPCMRSRDRRRR